MEILSISPDRVLRVSLRIGGILTVTIGLMHIFMPSAGYDNSIPSGMAPEIRNHFYYLATYAICGFLLTLGFLSVYASKIRFLNVSFVICIALGILWVGRTVLEILYPVEIRLFFLQNPTQALLPVIIFIALTYTAGSVAYMLRTKH